MEISESHKNKNLLLTFFFFDAALGTLHQMTNVQLQQTTKV